MIDLPHILNWRRVNARLTTSGQPDADQLAEIQSLGATHVINLGLGHGEGALDNEAEIVAALGMVYIHIPVDFENPTDQDFEAFKAAVEGAGHTLVHIHCVYNARVSAFIYRYAMANNEIPQSKAIEIMESIWRPGANWAAFIGNMAASNSPNLYAGKDY